MRNSYKRPNDLTLRNYYIRFKHKLTAEVKNSYYRRFFSLQEGNKYITAVETDK